MLVLSRKVGEKIVIGQNITLSVVEIRGNKIRLGIEAPQEVEVHRQEVFDAIQAGEAKPAAREPLPVGPHFRDQLDVSRGRRHL